VIQRMTCGRRYHRPTDVARASVPTAGTQTRGGVRSQDGECRWRCRKCLGEPFARVIYYSSGAIW